MSGIIRALGLSLDDVRLVLAVARYASFVNAARRTGIPLSTVSRAVARVEAVVGARLLQRTSRRVSVTEEGARLIAQAGPLFAEVEAVLDGTVDRDPEPAGTLRVTAPVMTGAAIVAPALFAFAARYPRIVLELYLTNTVLSLVEEGFDLAFRIGPIRDAELVARRVMGLPIVLVASPAFVRDALGGKPSVTAAALAELPAIVNSPARPWRLVRRGGEVEEVRPRARISINDPRAAIEAAKLGLGLVGVPAELAAHEQEGGALVLVAIADAELEPGEVFAVYPSRRQVPARVRAAIDCVMRHIAELEQR